jgi:hypothetical protein
MKLISSKNGISDWIPPWTRVDKTNRGWPWASVYLGQVHWNNRWSYPFATVSLPTPSILYLPISIWRAIRCVRCATLAIYTHITSSLKVKKIGMCGIFFAFYFWQFTYQTLRPTSSMNLTVLLSSSADPQSCLTSVAPSGQARSLCVLCV